MGALSTPGCGDPVPAVLKNGERPQENLEVLSTAGCGGTQYVLFTIPAMSLSQRVPGK